MEAHAGQLSEIICVVVQRVAQLPGEFDVMDALEIYWAILKKGPFEFPKQINYGKLS